MGALLRGGYREAGDLLVQAIPSASDEWLFDYVYCLESLLRQKGDLFSPPVLANVGGVTAGQFNSLTVEDQKLLGEELVRAWQKVRLRYKSVDDFAEGDSIYRSSEYARLQKHGAGKRMLHVGTVATEILWIAGVLVVIAVMMRRRRVSVSIVHGQSDPQVGSASGQGGS
jgi:hypothetical protein